MCSYKKSTNTSYFSSFTLSSNIKQNINYINIKRPNNLYSINNTFCEVIGVVDFDLYNVNIFNSKSLYRYNYFESTSIGCYEADDLDFNVYIVNKEPFLQETLLHLQLQNL